MAYSRTKNGIKMIKETYGVELDLSYYLKQSKLSSPEDALIRMFREAFQQIYLKDTLDMSGKSSKCVEFFKDFNNYVVFNLREDAPLNRSSAPKREMGLSPMEQYRIIKEIRNTGPKNDIEAVMMNYKKGNIRIRDMVAFAKNIDRHGGLTPKNMRILASYAEALKRVNASRTIGWKWRHPWRNNAEQRDAKVIEDLIKGDSLLHIKAVRGAEGELSAFDGIEKATLKSTLNVEKIEDYVEVAPDPNAPELEDWEIKKDNWFKYLDDINKQHEEEERLRQEELLKQQEKEKQDELKREQEKEKLKQQKLEEQKRKEEKAKSNPDSAKTAEELEAENQAAINDFLANLNAGIEQRQKERETLLVTKISIDDMKENIYQNNKDNPKIEEPKHEELSLEKN